jgi:mRNA interferase MazF
MDSRRGLGHRRKVKIQRGSLVLVALEPTLGHEQRGVRPCVVVSDPDVITSQKYPMLCVVPVSSTLGQGALYPRLEAGSSGLLHRSWALVDQLRSLDKQRVRKLYGSVSSAELLAIEEGLRLYLAL